MYAEEQQEPRFAFNRSIGSEQLAARVYTAMYMVIKYIYIHIYACYFPYTYACVEFYGRVFSRKAAALVLPESRRMPREPSVYSPGMSLIYMHIYENIYIYIYMISFARGHTYLLIFLLVHI